MVKDEQKWIKLFERFKKEELAGRLRFKLVDLEDFIQAKLGGASAYQAAGGYPSLYQLLRKLESLAELRAINSSSFNQRLPQLKKNWTLVKKEAESWSDKELLKLTRQLDLSYYLKRSEKQTEELKQKLFSLTDFLNTKAAREWASREERSLELFADEKYLSRAEGKKLLSNLNLNLADLKAQQYNHLFVYWSLDPTQINNILIMENHSAFIGAKKALAVGINIFNQDFDTVIFGQGKKIISSFSFLEELLGLESVLQNKNEAGAVIENDKQSVNQRQKLFSELNIYYAGDLDPEGLAIYITLKRNYPGFKIRLLGEYYQLLLEESKEFYFTQKKHNKSKKVLTEVLTEFKEQGFEILCRKLEFAWKNDMRLPQEVITLEVYKRIFSKN